ncbi:MAG: bifunctional 2-C-methyl-D-erythritol 4-phosphate cytidylyltransferase/2-C-methyl-D-erythritol 2,4-cyclodiphosphate synthase [Alphaproteobacteria bacterium]|nr:bifunctional 2-C-methyl-D-erythritol 4-phosphate cytidylyltransferase/2-C-methyl-D-erythritol 2,4-cyclodiphosphate synthase [Alphaproteobacteria bacterium]MCD8526229.1 bifunctional 2-C-methyl-D-erythritol 4-phosphate cytidylyltransferase/2-C-methyl-D-erythritol 2,4-cyclodiphosphate synthase [Alphaproteobacteria bacterium]
MINQNPRSFYVLVVAAGLGARFGGSIPKQFTYVHGKTVLRHAVEKFINIPGLKEISIVIDPDWKDKAEEALSCLPITSYPQGGNTRKESVFNGLSSFSNILDDDIILIHDAARPCVAAGDIQYLLTALDDHEGATLCAVMPDTLRRSSDLLTQEDIIRENLYSIQTPQAFRYGVIRKAHENAPDGQDFTDDTALLMAAGHSVKLVPGSRANIKLTTKEDLPMIEALLRPATTQTRTGTGFDVHVLEENPARPLMICGVNIPSNLTLTGHSDADVGLHALTDALLGAISEGDIGDHFPPSDNTYKDMDSALFLQKAVKLMQDKGAILVNTDITIICEAPKIGPHKAAMKARMAEILGVDEARVNIKATTTEKLGFTGRGEGIAAQAVVSVEFPA